MTRALAAALCAAWAASTAPGGPRGALMPAQEAPTAISARAALDAAFKRLMGDLPIVGLAAGIVHDDRLVWRGAYGLADIGGGRKVDSSTVFHTGSVSKTVTAAVLMRLWEAGRFQLDDDVNRHLAFPVRNPKFPDTPITFRMLLTHTSSISEIAQQAGRETLAALYGHADPDVGLGEITREFLVPGGKYYRDFTYSGDAPGTRYEYSNVGFALIGHLIERISGTSFHEYCRSQLLTPLGMPDSTYRLSDTTLARFAFPYRPDQADAARMIRIAPFAWAGYTDGGLRTTVADYGHLLSMLLNQGRYDSRQVFRPDTIATWLAPQKIQGMPPARGTIERVDYALGWPVHRLKGEVAYLHNGSGSGFGTYVYFVPSLETGGMIFVTGQPAPQALFPRLEQAIGLMVDAAREF